MHLFAFLFLFIYFNKVIRDILYGICIFVTLFYACYYINTHSTW